MDVSLHEDSAGEFCCAWSIFSTKLLGFVHKAIKFIFTEFVGQCRNIILPLAFGRSIHKRVRAIYSYTDLPLSY